MLHHIQIMDDVQGKSEEEDRDGMRNSGRKVATVVGSLPLLCVVTGGPLLGCVRRVYTILERRRRQRVGNGKWVSCCRAMSYWVVVLCWLCISKEYWESWVWRPYVAIPKFGGGLGRSGRWVL